MLDHHGIPTMTNFDHSIDDGLEEYLKSGGKDAKHAAWNFNGNLYYKEEDGLFYEDVYRYHNFEETFSAPTLQELMDEVNQEFGGE